MKSTLAFVQMNLRLALREKPVLFFNYVFPLIFFFFFAQMMNASTGSITQVVTMVSVIGVLGNGLFGAGIRSVTEREANILRRYRVAPISPVPILLASVITGWILYLPAVILLLTLAHNIYHMAVPPALVSFLLFISLGAMVFRCIGLIIAAVANSTAESTVLVQMLYMPMLFFSGTTIPISVLPGWLQVAAQFLPSAYLLSGLQAIILQQESILANGKAVLALSATGVLALFLAVKLFRWEKEEKLPRSAKLWVLAAFLPFVVLGSYQAYSRESITKTRLLERKMRRNHARLFRDARVFVGDGRILENASVLVRGGTIEAVYTDAPPDAKLLNADVIEASGKTLLPGLVDVHVHLSAPGGMYPDDKEYQNSKRLDRELAAYLYSGVTAVRSVGDPLDESLRLRSKVSGGDETAAELFACGPLFTTSGGHGTEYAKNIPEIAKAGFEKQFLRIPRTPGEAREQVSELKQRGVDCIKAIMESGAGGMLFNRMDPAILTAIGAAAKANGLPFSVHTGDARDVEDAVAAGASSIEHGSFRGALPDDLLQRMAKQGVFYDATLSVGEAFTAIGGGNFDLLNRSLLQQVAPAGMLASTRKALSSAEGVKMRSRFQEYPVDLKLAMANLKRASDAGVPIVAGSDAGNMLVIHGPTVHRELQLYVQAGISTSGALQAATYNAARLLRAEARFGSIRKGLEATLLLVDGNPLQDISATERISVVMLKGERIDRTDLFDQR